MTERDIVAEAKRVRRKKTVLEESKITVTDTDIELDDEFWEPAVALLHQILKKTEQ